MDQLEEVVLKRWCVRERMYSLLNELSGIKKSENETVWEFHTRFEKLLLQIPERSHPGKEYLTFLYTRAVSGQSGFLLDEYGPRTIQEAYDMAI
jgi:hypothetical protein